MCLYSLKKTPLVAKKDITCYKVLSYVDEDGHYISPMYYFHWFTGNPNPEVIYHISQFEHHDVRCWFFGKFKIGTGFFHTYQYLEEAKKLKHIIGLKNYCIVKCIIPKGTEYYVGYDDSQKDCYASKQLKIVKIIK